MPECHGPNGKNITTKKQKKKVPLWNCTVFGLLVRKANAKTQLKTTYNKYDHL